MSAGVTLQQSDFTLKDLLDMQTRSVGLSINCHAIGTIQSFDPVKQTATVSINYTKTFYELGANGVYNPVSVPYPPLIDCPIVILGGGTSHLTFPIVGGEECLVLFNDRDMDNWYQGSKSSQVNTPRIHNFADAIVLVGVRSAPNAVQNYDPTNPQLHAGSAKLSLLNNTTDLKSVLNAIITAINSLVITAPPGGGVCAVTPISPSPSPGGLLK